MLSLVLGSVQAQRWHSPCSSFTGHGTHGFELPSPMRRLSTQRNEWTNMWAEAKRGGAGRRGLRTCTSWGSHVALTGAYMEVCVCARNYSCAVAMSQFAVVFRVMFATHVTCSATTDASSQARAAVDKLQTDPDITRADVRDANPHVELVDRELAQQRDVSHRVLRAGRVLADGDVAVS